MTDFADALRDMSAAITAAPPGDTVMPPGPFADVMADIANVKPPEAKAAPTWSGSVFPISQDNAGKYQFDPNAGILGAAQRLPGAIWSGVSAPADVIEGRVMTPYSIPRPPVATGMGNDEASPNAIDRALDFTGVAGTPLSVARRAGELVPGAITGNFGAPSAEQLKAAASAGYDAARASGVTVPGTDIADMSRQLQQGLQNDHGVIAKTAPKTFSILDELANPPAGGIGTYPGLEAARRGLSTIASEGGTEGFAAQKAIGGLNKFIDAMAPEAADARANYAAAMRSNSLTGDLDRANTGIFEQADARAHASHSGTNLDNAIRQRVASFLQSPENVAGFSQPEIDALNSVVVGGNVQNAARRIGNVFGGGGGLGQLAAGFGGALAGGHLLGGEVGGPLGAMLPTAVGISAKGLENTLARRSLNNADEIVRQNSPLYREMKLQDVLATPAIGRNSAVLRSVLPGLISPSQAGKPPPSSLAALLANGA